MCENLAPTLMSSERIKVINYLKMTRDERAHYLGKALADPKISAPLLRVLGYLLTA